jgi:hypothetical protein
VAVLTSFAACFRGLCTVIGKIAPAALTTLLASFGSLLPIIREIARVVVAHLGISYRTGTIACLNGERGAA